jgi:hypothetical protein
MRLPARVNLTRFHGVFAPNSNHRVQVTPARRGKGSQPKAPDEAQGRTPGERRAAMTWAQRLKRVFRINIETCQHGGGPVFTDISGKQTFKCQFARLPKVRRWPFLAVQVMKSTRGCPTAACDPKLPFETERYGCPL